MAIALALLGHITTDGTCDYQAGWNRYPPKSCNCIGIKIMMENSLAVDGDYRAICLGYGISTPAQPTKSTNLQNDEDLQNWKTYRNTEYGFSVSFPEEYEVPNNNNDHGELGKKIAFFVSDFNPLDRKDDYPSTNKVESDVVITNLNAKRVEGITNIRGNIAQQFIQYVFNKNGYYYSFALFALDKSDLEHYTTTSEQNLPKISQKDLELFDQILSTFVFIE